MLLTSSALNSIYTGFTAKFNGGFAGAASQYSSIAMDMNSSTAEETYAWLGNIPRMREWIGDRVIQNLRAHGFTIKNRDFESTIEVPRNAIEDDRYSVYGPLFEELGREAGEQPDRLVFELLASGFTATCYDGQYFFDTDHPVRNKDNVEVSVSNFGGGAGTPWFLLDTSRGIRPLIYQKRRQYKLIRKDQPEDDNVFFKKSFIYGVDGRSNAGFGLWQLAYGSKQTLNTANYAAARAAMTSLRGDGGTLLGVKPTVLVVPSSLEEQGRRVIKAALEADGSSNIWQDTAELIVTPWLAADL